MSKNTAKWSKYTFLPEDVYEAEIAELKIVENPFEEGETQFQFKFKLSAENDEEVYVMKNMSQKLNEKSNFYGLYSAAMKEQPNKAKYPDGIAGEDLVGKKVRVSIKHQQGRDGKTYMKIDSFLSSKV